MSHSKNNPSDKDEFIKDCQKLLRHTDNALRDIDEIVKILLETTRNLYALKNDILKKIEEGK